MLKRCANGLRPPGAWSALLATCRRELADTDPGLPLFGVDRNSNSVAAHHVPTQTRKPFMKPGAQKSKHYRNQLVEVKSCHEILQTLDAEGKLEGLPFMPEMVAHCGKQIRVHRRADRTCVAGLGFRRLNATVFLHESRCDGSDHGGCQRACMLFWKEAWLRPAPRTPSHVADPAREARAGETLRRLVTRRADRYVCQSTELAGATTDHYGRWNVTPLLRDVAHGELTVRGFFAIAARAFLNRCTRWPRERPLVGTHGRKTRGDLALRREEWITVKSPEQIRDHLDENSGNCGLTLQPSMYGAIGGRYQVAFPIRQIIIEQTGKMVELQNTVALKGVTCQGPCAANCPRNEYLYWRESWLERTRNDA
jgi:hypothetical protein